MTAKDEIGRAAPVQPARRRFLGLAGGAAAALALTPAVLAPAALRAQEAAGPVYGNRVPRSWYWFQGLGVSDSGFGDNPYETFAYDLALRKGGIEDYNVIPYTSVVPRVSYGRIAKPERAADGTMRRPDTVAVTPGSVLEVIMSQQGMTVQPGQSRTICTGLGIRWAAEPGSPEVLRNGYAAEYVIAYDYAVWVKTAEKAAEDAIRAALDHELSVRGLVPYAPDGEPDIVVLANIVDNAGGVAPLYVTQITGIGCYEYIFPTVKEG